MKEDGDSKPEEFGKWQRARRSCGSIAMVLTIIGYGFLPFAATASSCAVNNVLVEFTAILSVIAGLLAGIGQRWWLLALSILLFLIVPMFASIGY